MPIIHILRNDHRNRPPATGRGNYGSIATSTQVIGSSHTLRFRRDTQNTTGGIMVVDYCRKHKRKRTGERLTREAIKTFDRPMTQRQRRDLERAIRYNTSKLNSQHSTLTPSMAVDRPKGSSSALISPLPCRPLAAADGQRMAIVECFPEYSLTYSDRKLPDRKSCLFDLIFRHYQRIGVITTGNLIDRYSVDPKSRLYAVTALREQ